MPLLQVASPFITFGMKILTKDYQINLLQPDYKIFEMNKRLQQRTDDSDNLWLENLFMFLSFYLLIFFIFL